jgi:formate hydrogenlyase transcriptional activator
MTLIGSYNYALVALSVFIAMFASYAALDLAGRVTAAAGWTRAVWLLGGAAAMGTGIWSMHYIGMLAFILPIPVAYHWPTVLLSLFAAILASIVALGVVSRQKMSWSRALAGSVLMGAGIAGMHYIGMAAMRLPAFCRLNSSLVVLSVVLAVLISLVALWITFHFRHEKTGIGWGKLDGAVLLGAAIPVMHYTGMAAASFTSSGMPMDLSHSVSISTIGTTGIVAGTFIVLGLAVLTSWVDRRFAAQALEVQEEKLQQSEAYLSEAQRLSHTGSFGWRPSTGEIIWSEETFRIFQFDQTTKPTVELILQRVHPDDAVLVQQTIGRAAQDEKDFNFEHRLLMPDGCIKYLRVVARPSGGESGRLQFVGAVTDITERKRAEAVRDGESRILEMIARDAPLEESLEQLVRVVEAQFANLLCSILLLDEDGQHVRHGAAPSLPKPYVKAIDGLCIGPKAGSCGTAMYRREPVVVTDILQDPLWEAYRDVVEPYGFRACWSTPMLAHSGKTLGSFAMYYREPRSPSPAETHALEMATRLAGIAIERKRAEETLRASEAYLAEAQRMARCGSWAWNVPTGAIFWSQETFRIYDCDPEKTIPTWSYILDRVHPEDRPGVEQRAKRESTRKDTVNSEGDFRIVFPDGRIKHLHSIAHPVMNVAGEITEVVGTTIDVTERKRAEEKIRQSERELRQLIDLTPLHITELGPDGTPLYNNKAALDYHGLTLEQWKTAALDRLLHPQDAERVAREVPGKFQSGSPYEIEARFRRKDGQYRWFVFRFNPIRDEQGRLIRWYAAATDIEDRKQAEQQLQNENVALREEIDRASMFEEIVGSSPALYSVLSRLSKVAPTDSTVLITGETGTGKELVARAVHKRSQRASRAFVNVNCAAIPRDLIASELFGHEKGAFTGATQRRLGRFELAEGGTIFLDEVGELPAETQVALLRVLQEHEFERVGGTASIRANVRVIAATNRDLQAAIAAGTFRSDLFYRLNVFPIKVPPLRERREDIPMLVEYFIDRYASSAGKSIRGVAQRSLDLLQSYPWPGNIRELQNVIERSVIVCDAENFSVDESWLSQPPLQSDPKSEVDLSGTLAAQEKEIIETALRECGGRVSGPTGAAVRLGLPGSTLDSKIKLLKINKNRFKSSDPSQDRV